MCVFVWGDENGLPIEPYYLNQSDPHVQAVLPAKVGSWFVAGANSEVVVGQVREIYQDNHGWMINYDTVLNWRSGVWHHYRNDIAIPLNVTITMLAAARKKLACSCIKAHYVSHPNTCCGTIIPVVEH